MFYNGYIQKRKNIKWKCEFIKKFKNNIINNFDIETFSIAFILFFVLIIFILLNYNYFVESINLILYKNKNILESYLNKNLEFKNYKSLYLNGNEQENNEANNEGNNIDKIEDSFVLINKNIYSSFIYNSDIYNIVNSIGGDSNVVLEPVNYIKYKTESGDTLWGISKKFGISVDSIYSANREKLKDAHSLKVSDEIIIPTQTGILIEIKDLEDLNKKIEEYDVDVLSIYIANRVSTKEELLTLGKIFLPNVELPMSEKLKVYGVDFGLPTYGYITSGFGFRIDPFLGVRRFHAGIDIANSYSTPIYSAFNGVVVYTGWDGGYGLKIVIKHQLGYETVYGHLSKISVKVGQYVSKGQIIGYMGSSGRSTGSHLHFEIRRFGRLLNPRLYIRGLPYKRK